MNFPHHSSELGGEVVMVGKSHRAGKTRPRPVRLDISEIDEVSLVDRGCNPGAIFMHTTEELTEAALRKTSPLRRRAWALTEERLGVDGKKLMANRRKSAHDQGLWRNFQIALQIMLKEISQRSKMSKSDAGEDVSEGAGNGVRKDRETLKAIAKRQLRWCENELSKSQDQRDREAADAITEGITRGISKIYADAFNKVTTEAPEYAEIAFAMQSLLAELSEVMRTLDNRLGGVSSVTNEVTEAIEDVEQVVDDAKPANMGNAIIDQFAELQRERARVAAEERRLQTELAAQQAELERMREEGRKEQERQAAAAARRQAEGEREAARQAREREKEEAARRIQERTLAVENTMHEIATMDRIRDFLDREQVAAERAATAILTRNEKALSGFEAAAKLQEIEDARARADHQRLMKTDHVAAMKDLTLG